MECQLLARSKMYSGESAHYKKRHLKDLPLETRNDIVKMYLEDGVFQKDVAKFYKISPLLVSKLVKESKTDPEKRAKQKLKEEEKRNNIEAVKAVVTEMLEKSVSIVKADFVLKEVLRKHNLLLSKTLVMKVLKDELGLGYRMARDVPLQGNSERCLVLRQQYAMKMLELLNDGKRILNVDESWLNDTNFTRKIWCPP